MLCTGLFGGKIAYPGYDVACFVVDGLYCLRFETRPLTKECEVGSSERTAEGEIFGYVLGLGYGASPSFLPPHSHSAAEITSLPFLAVLLGHSSKVKLFLCVVKHCNTMKTCGGVEV
jgi:hypothetical protein